MSSRSPPPQSTLPSWVLLLLGVVILLATSLLLAALQYQQHSRIIVDSGNVLLAGAAQRVQQSLIHTYRAPIQALNLLALEPFDAALNLTQRLVYLEKFSQVLTGQPHLNAIYAGWQDGDLLLMRPLHETQMRERFDVPDAAMWMVWHIDNQATSGETLHLFYDQNLKLLETRPQTDTGFDPRQRGWYQAATNSDTHIITKPYVFFSTSEFGTTVARSAGDRTVIGADITLNRLSTILAGHGATAASELLLYDDQGTVLAYQDARRIMNTAHGSELRLKTFNELGSTLLATLAEDGYLMERETTMVLEGRQWLVLQKKLTLQHIADTYLALLIPTDELMAGAYRIRTQSVWISLLISLVLLPGVGLITYSTLRLKRLSNKRRQN
ncbi:MAG TPA: hypothetical protein ENI17_11260 [Pseudomonas xinjiangensis]|uniref:Cache domain-containing protein n=2 Tax=root TaxID=1 RepID=A0A7V1BRV2_9GAMM|nr:hypothetical protein [Halopseudomonas xinjiangensis]HEC48190.1 hypothetical protein [Halopseudomonas xinjiangensis]